MNKNQQIEYFLAVVEAKRERERERKRVFVIVVNMCGELNR